MPRELNVLLAGPRADAVFDPNPGAQVISHLDGTIMKASTSLLGKTTDLRLRIDVAFPVGAYVSRLETVPQLYGLEPQWPPQEGPDDPKKIAARLAERRYDLIVHCEGSDGRVITLEHDAPRFGYPDRNDYPDKDDPSDRARQGAPLADGRRGLIGAAWDGLGQGEDELFVTRLDADKIVDRLHEAGFSHVQVGYGNSGAPCPFTHATGLASAMRVAKALGHFATTAAFVHVPPFGDLYDEQTARKTVEALVWLAAEQAADLSRAVAV